MIPRRVRAIAIGVVEDERGRWLVFEGYDPVKGDRFYRPLGGAIEFGERGRDCLAREFREEIGAELEDVTYLGVIESIFTCAGEPGHEIVLVYRARFRDPRFYRRETMVVREEVETLTARWMPREAFASGSARLVPDGLLDLAERGNRAAGFR
ncbi:MAG: NUDIX domain-containing protein [Anaerolineae bacterium]|nr:NUDIX domain-containing protein [Anaerolineae bacterium]